ncbi:MAG TPA: hypothetical protein VF778_13500 [Xanthobacteraceae bacterium]
MMSTDRTLDLRTKDDDGEQMIHRPRLHLWIEDDCVTLSVGPEYGGATRYVSMNPAEARRLAAYLTELAQETLNRAIRDNEQIQHRQGKLPREYPQ